MQSCHMESIRFVFRVERMRSSVFERLSLLMKQVSEVGRSSYECEGKSMLEIHNNKLSLQ